MPGVEALFLVHPIAGWVRSDYPPGMNPVLPLCAAGLPGDSRAGAAGSVAPSAKARRPLARGAAAAPPFRASLQLQQKMTQMKYRTLLLWALTALAVSTGLQVRADNMVSIGIAPATGAVTLEPRWAIGGSLAGFHLMAQDLSLGGGPNQFYSIASTPIPAGGDVAAFVGTLRAPALRPAMPTSAAS